MGFDRMHPGVTRGSTLAEPAGFREARVFDWLIRYFWFVCAGAMVLNVIAWRRHLLALVASGSLTAFEAQRLTRGAALWLVGVPVILGLIALAAGWPDPLCAGALSFRDMPSAVTSVILLVSWAALLWWVWLGRGAELLRHAGPALANSPSIKRAVAPSTVRLLITAVVLWSAIGGALMWRRSPAAVTDRCDVSASEPPAERFSHVAR